MKLHEPIDVTHVPGIAWNGRSTTLSGAPLRLLRQIDSMFQSWARDWRAEEWEVAPTLDAQTSLAKSGYFEAFPHLATFPVTLERDEQSLARFASATGSSPGSGFGIDGELELGRTEPARSVLTPAACYHFYTGIEGAELETPALFTTESRCWRREEYFRPLERHGAFRMREIACVGGALDIGAFLARARARLEGLFASLGLPVRFENATDPFFQPSKSAAYLMQSVAPLKIEMIFGDDLAIGSLNYHQRHFGDAYSIRIGDEPASSGCVAFGLERWLFAFLTHFGPDERSWPSAEALSHEN